MVTWLYQGVFYLILYVYFVSNVLQWTCIALLTRKKNHNLKYRVLMLGTLSGMVCSEALCSPGNDPADQNNMLGRRIFLVLLRMS